MKAPTCPYCNRPSVQVTGRTIYPHRRDLYGKTFYQCAPCDAYVGTHPGTVTPLGRLANAELRRAKQAAHSALDPLWQHATEGRGRLRRESYKWLAEQLGIDKNDCHIGMFDVETCNRVVQICNQRNTP